MSPAPYCSDGMPAVFRLCEAEIDRQRFTATRDGQVHALTARELKLAEVFATNQGLVLTRDALLNAVWGGNSVEQTEYLRVFIRNLRKKVELDPNRPRYLLTEPWVGYRFVPGT